MPDSLPDWLTVLVIFVAVPLTWYVTWLLFRLSRGDPDGAALSVMGQTFTCVALIVTVFAAVFVNNGMDDPVLNGEQTQIVTRSALLILSVVPPLSFLRWYRRNGNGHGA